MLIPHLHFRGSCYLAMQAYVKAFGAEIDAINFIDQAQPEKGILHAEMTIHGQRVMLNDNRSEDCAADYPFAQMVVTFATEADLHKAFEILKDEQRVVSPMQATDYTSCTVGFWDKFGIRWGFMVE